MSNKLAIKGHPTRSKEVIELLKMMGGKDSNDFKCRNTNRFYHVLNEHVCWGYIGPEEIDEYNIFTLEEFLEKFPYKVGDKVNSPCKGCVKTITSMKWDDYLNTVSYKLDNKIYTTIEQLKVVNDLPYKEEVNIKDNKLFGTLSNPVETKSYAVSLKDGEVIDNSIDSVQFIQSGKIVAVRFNTQNYENEVELQLDDYEIEIRDGKYYAVRKKLVYPKTYAECKEILPKNVYYGFSLFSTLRNLIICRDAYWKIAGEEMGMDKPWKPDWNEETNKFTISNKCNKIYLNNTAWYAEVLSFPTAEMRDAFYDNFKKEIEECKELL